MLKLFRNLRRQVINKIGRPCKVAHPVACQKCEIFGTLDRVEAFLHELSPDTRKEERWH